MLVARGYNFACIKKRSNCITVPTLLSMIVATSATQASTFSVCSCIIQIEIQGSLVTDPVGLSKNRPCPARLGCFVKRVNEITPSSN